VPRTSRQLLAAFQQAMLDFSADDLADLFAADAAYEFPFLAPQRGTDRYDGRDAIRAGFSHVWGSLPAPPVTGFRDVRVHDTTDPEVVIAELEFAAIDHRTGRSFNSRSLLVLRGRDGEIQHVRDYADVLRVAKGLGRLTELLEGLRDDQPAYLLSEMSPRDPDALADYRAIAAKSIDLHGGRYLVRGGPVHTIEGDWPTDTTVVLVEFPSRAHLDRWYTSTDYALALELRETALERRLVALTPTPNR